MTSEPDFDQVEESLRRCGASWGAAQAHGLITSQMVVTGASGMAGCLLQLLEGCEANDALRKECENILASLYDVAYRQLTERLSAFDLLLPDEAAGTADRAAALAAWSEGFLHGLVSGPHMAGPNSSALKQTLAAEPLAEIIRDMLEITRAASTDEDSVEEESCTELVEYLRVAAQLAYEELAGFREGSAS
jgi:uncharacterized protein YgfB (UPF0149 family)